MSSVSDAAPYLATDIGEITAPNARNRRQVSFADSPSITVTTAENAKRKLDSLISTKRRNWFSAKTDRAITLEKPPNVVQRGWEVVLRIVSELTWGKRGDRIKDQESSLQNAAAGLILHDKSAQANDWADGVIHYLRQLQSEGHPGSSDVIAQQVALQIRAFEGDWNLAAQHLAEAIDLIDNGKFEEEIKKTAFHLLEKISIRCKQEELKDDLRVLFKQYNSDVLKAWDDNFGDTRYASLTPLERETANNELLNEGWGYYGRSREFLTSGNAELSRSNWFLQGGQGPKGTCGLCSVEFIRKQRGQSAAKNERDIYKVARRLRLCDKDGGTTLTDQKLLLKHYGIDAKIVRLHENSDWARVSKYLANYVERKRGVICAVNNGILWDDAQYYSTGNINHAITLVGVVRDRQMNLVGFHINDAGVPFGRYRFIPTGWLREAMVPGSSYMYTV